MKKIKSIIAIIALIFLFACKSNKEKATASSMETQDETLPPMHQNLEPAFPSKSTDFRVGNFENGQFYLTVFYSDTSIKVPVRWYLDDKDITKEIYDDIISRKGAIFEVWVTKKRNVNHILLFDNPPSQGARSIWIANEFPIDARSSD